LRDTTTEVVALLFYNSKTFIVNAAALSAPPPLDADVFLKE
jgi:hypothetical protein